MLRRTRQIKMQIQQMLDACLFGLSFLLAWAVRSNSDIVQALGLPAITWTETYFWLYIVLIVAGPLVLETQGYYDRALLSIRGTALWPLLRSCLLTTIGLVMILFFFHMDFPRGVAVLFGFISFMVILSKEEVLRLVLNSKFARTQFQRRFVLVGTEDETSRMRDELKAVFEDELVILAEINLNEKSVDELTRLLHEHSVNGVIINARHYYFEKVEAAIRTCEIEGVEVWLIADFFRTQISHTSFDEMFTAGPCSSSAPRPTPRGRCWPSRSLISPWLAGAGDFVPHAADARDRLADQVYLARTHSVPPAPVQA